MTAVEFIDHVEATPGLEVIDTAPGKALVRHAESKACYSVEYADALVHTWDEIVAVLTAKRGAKIISHMTRIVGYYSMIDNWNKSKLGELAARRKGNYGIA